MTDITRVAARHLGRPLLLTPQAAEFYVRRIQSIDPNFSARPGRLNALVRRLTGAERDRLATAAPVMAMEDDEPRQEVPFGQLGAYQPLYVGDVDDTGFCWALKDGIALMECNTPLLDRGERFCGTVWHGYDTLLMAMRDAAADERVKAIFLRADSPGGVVSGGLGVLAKWMRENRGSAGGKPIHVYADMACSAMYWIAANGDKIDAPDVGQVGSIGAVLVHESIAGWLEKTGIEITSIEFPEGGSKTDGAWWKALSEGARADLQSEINQCGRNFTADVAAGRKQLTVEKQIGFRAGCFLAHHDDPARSGLALGLCDEIMGEEAAFAALADSVSGAAPVTQRTLALAASATTQEQPMADKADDKAAKVAALKTDLKAAIAAKDKAKADSIRGQLKAEGVADDDMEEDGEDVTETPPAEKDKNSGEGDTEAQKIAKSAEARSHPELAHTAIAQSLTLAQFQAMAASAPRKQGRLAQFLDGSPRLGADTSEGDPKDAGSRLAARAQARATKLTGGK